MRRIVEQAADRNSPVMGAMLESNLAGGSQSFPRPVEELVYGCSITDGCIDWETTEALLRESHAALAGRVP
jgi:3-deoxy-7-phosphoheptulonate synthase